MLLSCPQGFYSSTPHQQKPTHTHPDRNQQPSAGRNHQHSGNPSNRAHTPPTEKQKAAHHQWATPKPKPAHRQWAARLKHSTSHCPPSPYNQSRISSTESSTGTSTRSTAATGSLEPTSSTTASRTPAPRRGPDSPRAAFRKNTHRAHHPSAGTTTNTSPTTGNINNGAKTTTKLNNTPTPARHPASRERRTTTPATPDHNNP